MAFAREPTPWTSPWWRRTTPWPWGAWTPSTPRASPASARTPRPPRIESSKVFAKDLMQKYHIPTARYEVFTSPAEAGWLSCGPPPSPSSSRRTAWHLGKGVLISRSYEEAEGGGSGPSWRTGPLGDSGSRGGHRRVLDRGRRSASWPLPTALPSPPWCPPWTTSGRGTGTPASTPAAWAPWPPNPCYTEDIAQVCMDTIFLPTPGRHAGGGLPLQGLPVLRIDADPGRAQGHRVQLPLRGPRRPRWCCPLLKTDLLTVMQAVENETLGELTVEWRHASAACVILALRRVSGPL